MSSRHASRLWLLGGVLVIAVLITATYLLAIKPVYDEKALTETQIAETDLQLTKLKRQLADLKIKSKYAETYRAQLAAKKTQLPDSYDIPDFLRQLQTSDTAVRVDNDAVGVSTPVEVTGSTTVVGVPITLTAKGTVPNLMKFISRLQNTQNRAVLITSVTLSASGESESGNAVNLVLTAFCSKIDDSDCQLTT